MAIECIAVEIGLDDSTSDLEEHSVDDINQGKLRNRMFEGGVVVREEEAMNEFKHRSNLSANRFLSLLEDALKKVTLPVAYFFHDTSKNKVITAFPDYTSPTIPVFYVLWKGVPGGRDDVACQL